MSSRSPIVSASLDSFVYLRNSIGGSHFKGSELVLHSLITGATEILVNLVDEANNQFPGIYTQRLPFQFYKDFILLSTCWYNERVLFNPVINIFVNFLACNYG